MEAEPVIVYSCIARGTLILVEHAQSYENNFTEVVHSMMRNLASHSDYKAVYKAHESYLFHVIIENGIAYFCVTTPNFSKLGAHRFIQEIITRIKSTNLASRVNYAGEYELNREFSVVLGQEMDHYTRMKGFEENDNLSKLQRQVDDVKQIMTENIEKVLSRGELLDDLLSKTEDLEASSKSFQSSSRQVRKQFFWKNTRVTIVIVAVSVILLAVIVVVVLKLTHVI
ncbi:Vesicle-associated membrane protein 7 [Holothuria leucospilota]|uniref:Vesicle-associated membrane protein 7 n=1 Tax=Holothuria leucospilota TaxID=206669 RepID=A0A9Q0YHN7_HOLLE|nr:Vesicle-associated membrane protein 7 [Holothuria leucospilota]